MIAMSLPGGRPDGTAGPGGTRPPADNPTTGPRWLEQLASPRGAAALALAGLLVSVASLLTSTSLTRINVLGPIAFAFLLWLAWRQRKKVLIGATALALLVSLTLVIRTYSAPGTVTFWYNGQPVDTSGTPFARDPGIPLTRNPDEGYVYSSIVADPEEIEVSCTHDGVINFVTRSTSLEWAHIVGGKFRTLWVPMPFVRGEVPGGALTLLPCSDWRWRLQSLGRQ